MEFLKKPEKSWDELSQEEKTNSLHEDLGKLFSIVENLSHQDHIFTDAMHLVHAKLESLAKSITSMKKKAEERELIS